MHTMHAATLGGLTHLWLHGVSYVIVKKFLTLVEVAKNQFVTLCNRPIN